MHRPYPHNALILAALLSASGALSAQDEQEYAPPVPVPEPPDIPEQVQSGQSLEPEVTIVRTPQATVTEYRVNGVLYQIKVQPRWGYPYYLVDVDGDGRMESRRDGLGPGFLVPAWVLFRW